VASGLRKGLTLFELLIVIVVLGILTAFSVSTFSTTVDSALEASLQHDVKNGIIYVYPKFGIANSFTYGPDWNYINWYLNAYMVSPGNTSAAANATQGSVEIRAWNTVANRRCHETIGKPAVPLACENGIY